jgi:acyl-CoA thioesterase FadM
MYPFFKFASVLLKAKFRERININDKSILHFRAGLTDIDMFMEMNNARYFSYMELGRWDYSFRVGFLSLMKKKKWGIAVGGASIRYRRRIPFFTKFSITTELICHDGRWFYFLQEFHRKNTICASALMKVCATSKQGLVPATEVLKDMGIDVDAEIPVWVNAWIEAEGLRPWHES